MPTLSEYAKLSNDVVKAGVLENIITWNELIPVLAFKSVSGNAFTYNRENALPTTATHQVGDIWTDSEPTFNQKTASLTIVGVQSPLDRYAAQTRGNVQDQKAVLYASMAKSLGRKIADLTITGEPEATTTHWEGLDSLVRSETRMMAMDDGNVDGPGAAESELTIDRLDAMIDLVEAPDTMKYLIMNKVMRRKLTALSRATGSGVVMNEISMFGHKVRTYGGIPIIVNDFITNAEQYNDASTWPSSTATSIFCVVFGEENQGFTILHNGPVLDPDIQEIGIKEQKNENLYRMVAYLQAIVFSAKKVAALGGIDSAA